MGHTFYIAAVAAKRPTHIVFSLENGIAQVIYGPASFEQIAEKLRSQFGEADYIRDLPEEIETLDHNGTILQLEPMKSWHYIPFERLVTRDVRQRIELTIEAS
jgi:hypothetical protein